MAGGEYQAEVIVVDKSGGCDLRVVFKEKYGATREYVCSRVILIKGKYQVKTMDALPLASLDADEWSIIKVTDESPEELK